MGPSFTRRRAGGEQPDGRSRTFAVIAFFALLSMGIVVAVLALVLR